MAVKLFHKYSVEEGKVEVKIYMVEEDSDFVGKVVETSLHGYGHHYDFYYKYNSIPSATFKSYTECPLGDAEIFQEFQENVWRNK
jgi:hypothetical protein